MSNSEAKTKTSYFSCNKKLFTGPGLAIHCMQVHKETINKIPGALPGKDSVDVEVYGMEGMYVYSIIYFINQ